MTIKIREKTRKERTEELKPIKNKKLPLSFCIPNLNCEGNFAVILRTAVAFGFSNAFLIGHEGPDIKAKSCYTNEFINIKKFTTPGEFLAFWQNQKKPNLKLISIEIAENSIAIQNALQILKNYQTSSDDENLEICIVLGNESFGIPPGVILNSDLVVHIEMKGPIPCMNVAAAASIAFWEFSRIYK